MKNKKFITVFTPTFNREKLLNRLYRSLKEQKFTDFEWIIYDDGSTDNTASLINTFITENIIDIEYVRSKNQGKHVAINYGVEKAKGEMFFIVDSDDYLPEGSLLDIFNVWNSIDNKDKAKFAGVGGRRNIINREKKQFNLKEQYCDVSAIEFNLGMGNLQDKAEVYVTDVLKKYKFPVFHGENFITEAVVWFNIANDGYKIRWFDKEIYICEFLEDGLTFNSYNKRIKNLNSTCYAYNKISSYNIPKKYKLRYKANYFRFGLTKSSFKDLTKDLIAKDFLVSSMLMGSLGYLKDILLNKNK